MQSLESKAESVALQFGRPEIVPDVRDVPLRRGELAGKTLS